MRSDRVTAEAAPLVAAIEAQPYDSDVYAVYGDYLVERGDPRGELIALQIAAERDPSKAAAADAFLAEHEATMLGHLAGYLALETSSEPRPPAFTWRYGFIHRATLLRFFDIALDDLLSHPSGRFLVELALGTQHSPRLPQAIATLQQHAPRTLQVLQLGDARADNRYTGMDLEALWPALPNLRRLVVDGGHFRIGALPLPLPHLEHLELHTSGLEPANLEALVRTTLPALRTLVLGGFDQHRYGRPHASRPAPGQAMAALLEAAPRTLPALRHLAVHHYPLGGQIVQLLAASPALERLESLDLSRNGLSRASLRTFEAFGDRFRHLGFLDLSHNRLVATPALASLATRVVLEPQA